MSQVTKGNNNDILQKIYDKKTTIVGIGVVSSLFFMRKHLKRLVNIWNFNRCWRQNTYGLKKNKDQTYFFGQKHKEILQSITDNNGLVKLLNGPKGTGKKEFLRTRAMFQLEDRMKLVDIDGIRRKERFWAHIASNVGYPTFWQENILFRAFDVVTGGGERELFPHDLIQYLNEMGRYFRAKNQGKVPILGIYGLEYLHEKNLGIFEELAFLARSLANSQEMGVVINTGNTIPPEFIKHEFLSVRENIFFEKLPQDESEEYSKHLINNDHPLKEKILHIMEQKKNLIGGNCGQLQLFATCLQEAKVESDLEKQQKIVEDKIRKEFTSAMKHSGLEQEKIENSEFWKSALQCFYEINEKDFITKDWYLSQFESPENKKKALDLLKSNILYKQKKEIRFSGQFVKYWMQIDYLEKNKKNITKERELRKARIKGFRIYREFVPLIEKSIVNQNLKTTFKDLIGREDVIKELKESIIYPIKNPELFSDLRKAPKGILFYGPPGTGKTSIVKAIATEGGDSIKLFNVSSDTFRGKNEGDSEKIMMTLFGLAKESQILFSDNNETHTQEGKKALTYSLIFIDEIDSILSKRKETDSENARALKNQFLLQMQGISSDEKHRFIVIGATNLLDDLDQAVLRRFEKQIYISLPNKIGREQAFKDMLRKEKHELKEDQIGRLAEKSKDYSFGHIFNLCKEASFGPLKELSQDQILQFTKKEVRPINEGDFEEVFKKIKPTVKKPESNEDPKSK